MYSLVKQFKNTSSTGTETITKNDTESMQIKVNYIVTLIYEEAHALLKLLGKLSTNDKKSLGLDEAECERTSELYNAFPDLISQE